MTPFLDQVARHYDAAGGVEDLCFILPNRRAVAFFRKYLGACVARRKQPMRVPALYTMNDFFYRLADARQTDQVHLLLELDDCYKPLYEQAGAKAESLDESIRFQGNDNFVFAGSTRFYSARCDGGTLCISRDDGQILYIRDSTYYFGGNSVFCSGDDIYALVNPRERERPPSVWHGGRETEYVINGYLTGVEVEITLPNL